MSHYTAMCHVRAAGHNALLIQLWHCIYPMYLMFLHLSFFCHFFFTYLLPYLSFPLRTDLLGFQAECRNRRLNLVLAF